MRVTTDVLINGFWVHRHTNDEFYICDFVAYYRRRRLCAYHLGETKEPLYRHLVQAMETGIFFGITDIIIQTEPKFTEIATVRGEKIKLKDLNEETRYQVNTYSFIAYNLFLANKDKGINFYEAKQDVYLESFIFKALLLNEMFLSDMKKLFPNIIFK